MLVVQATYPFRADDGADAHLRTIRAQTIAIDVNLNTDIAKGIFDQFRSLLPPRSAPLLGAVLGDVVRYVIVTVSTLAVGHVVGFRIITDPLSAVAGCALAMLFALCLSWLRCSCRRRYASPARPKA